MVDGGDTFYTDWEETYESFDQMNLHENLLRGIYAYGDTPQNFALASWRYSVLYLTYFHLQSRCGVVSGR